MIQHQNNMVNPAAEQAEGQDSQETESFPSALSGGTGAEPPIQLHHETGTTNKSTPYNGLDYTVNKSTFRQPAGKFLPKWEKGKKEIERVNDCGSKVTRWEHLGCGASWYVPQSCNSRWCTKCSRRRADSIVDKYFSSLHQMKRPALCTFTVPNCGPGYLSLTLTVLTEAFRRIRRLKDCTDSAKPKRYLWPKTQGIFAVEIKWNEKTGYHPHIHALVDWQWRDLQEISKQWKKITEKLFASFDYHVQVKHQPDIKVIKRHQIKSSLEEVVKYACGVKRGEGQAEFPGYPYEVKLVLASHMSGQRMVTTYGKLKQEKEPKEQIICPHCGAEYHWWNHEGNWHREQVLLEDYEIYEMTKPPNLRYKHWDKKPIIPLKIEEKEHGSTENIPAQLRLC